MHRISVNYQGFSGRIHSADIYTAQCEIYSVTMQPLKAIITKNPALVRQLAATMREAAACADSPLASDVREMTATRWRAIEQDTGHNAPLDHADRTLGEDDNKRKKMEEVLRQVASPDNDFTLDLSRIKSAEMEEIEREQERWQKKLKAETRNQKSEDRNV